MVRKTLKNNKKKGGIWPFDSISNTLAGDNNLVILSTEGNDVLCSICKNANFQRRRATFGKSKMANFATDIIVDDEVADIVGDISVICYFCNNCGNCITVRDPKTTSPGTYTNLIKSTSATTTTTAV
jgi:polyferredoxin